MQQFVSFRRHPLVAGSTILLLLVISYYLFHPSIQRVHQPSFTYSKPERAGEIIDQAREITYHPPEPSAFGERGRISAQLAQWIDETGIHDYNTGDYSLRVELEDAVAALYPFILHPSIPNDQRAFAYLRSRQEAGSRGIVIAVGKDHFRYAAHLIANLRDVLESSLPIEIAYAGEDDLPQNFRTALESLGHGISCFDVTTVFADETLDLAHGGWAIKPFAVLASRFEETIFLDADTVFLQKPEVLFDEHQGYKSTGALLFHDRLLFQNVFKDRTKWWHEQMEGHVPSAALNGSKVWTENYGEEVDSGVVVINKKSTLTMLGMLHVAWQNSKAIRDEWTYKITYGDKESWWFGLELTGVPFAFEEHYGAVLGESDSTARQRGICGFCIAHLDELQRLIWFNGSLLKNKAVNSTEYWVPSHYMVDGVWHKGATKADMSCMTGGKDQQVTEEDLEVLRRTIARAQELDVWREEATAPDHITDALSYIP